MTDLTEPNQASARVGATGSTPTASGAQQQAGSVASSASTEAKAVASEAAAEAKNLLADTRQQLRAQADEQSAKVASMVGDIANQLQRMAAAGEPGPAKDVLRGVADQAQQMSQRLGEGGLDRTLSDARRMARNRPGLFLAGAALAGFVAARIVRVADTESLKQAATGSNGSSSASGAWDEGLTPAATTPLPPAMTTTDVLSPEVP